jgi:hypothetical protein
MLHIFLLLFIRSRETEEALIFSVTTQNQESHISDHFPYPHLLAYQITPRHNVEQWTLKHYMSEALLLRPTNLYCTGFSSADRHDVPYGPRLVN